jgi:hypothetical protein
MSRRARAIVVAVGLVVTRPVSADDRGLAVLVGASDGDPIVLKISDELRALGFEVEVAPPGSDRDRIRSRAGRDDAVAVVLVDEREVEVHVAVGKEVQLRHIPRRQDTDTSTSALAAVELVRGYLVPVDARAPNDSGQTPPDAPGAMSAPRDDELRSLSVRLGVGLENAGNFPTQGAMTLGVAKQFGRAGIEVSAAATIPRAEAWSGGIGVGLRYALLGHARPISLVVAGGLAGLAVAYQEDAKKWTIKAAALPYVDLAVRVAITGPFAVRADGMIAVAIPAPEFKSKTGSDVRFGSSVTAVSAGVELVW